MNEKALFIVIVLYAGSFGFLAIQYIYADFFGMTLTSFTGVPLKPAILGFIETDTFNEITNNVLTINSTTDDTIDAINRAFMMGANLALEAFQLITGTYIFNILYVFDVPPIFIAGLMAIYFILALRQLISIIRNG